MDRRFVFPLLAAISALYSAPASAQHCAPIVESYLGEVRATRSGDRIGVRFEYVKVGGRPMAAYQAYLIAYRARDADKVPSAAPKDLIDPTLVYVVRTKVVTRGEDGSYRFDFDANADELARSLAAHFKLTEKDREGGDGWGAYKDRFRLAVFIPFLDDRSYSIAAGLPSDRHECNYARDRALLFQPLPQALSLHFGPTLDGRDDKGKLSIRLHGTERH